MSHGGGAVTQPRPRTRAANWAAPARRSPGAVGAAKAIGSSMKARRKIAPPFRPQSGDQVGWKPPGDNRVTLMAYRRAVRPGGSGRPSGREPGRIKDAEGERPAPNRFLNQTSIEFQSSWLMRRGADRQTCQGRTAKTALAVKILQRGSSLRRGLHNV
jgi:hypothetical protein